MAWVTSGPVNNAADGTVLLDTGALPAGAFSLPLFVISADAPSNLRLEWRNAANGANIRSQILVVIAGTMFFEFRPASITVALNERVRLVTMGTVSGNIQASIFN